MAHYQCQGNRGLISPRQIRDKRAQGATSSQPSSGGPEVEPPLPQTTHHLRREHAPRGQGDPFVEKDSLGSTIEALSYRNRVEPKDGAPSP